MNDNIDNSLFINMTQALEDGIQWARGEKVLEVTVLETSDPDVQERTNTQEYAVLYMQGEDGWEATVPDLPGCEAVGDSLEEAQNLIRYFIKMHLQTLRRNGVPIPQPKTHAEQVSVAA